ncbi:hypothetical protein QP580_08670, partial [Prevotella bivia]|nr:hypothetical protein [Prevotella bivia]
MNIKELRKCSSFLFAHRRPSGDLFPDFVTQKIRILQLIDKQSFVSLLHLFLGDAKGFLTMFVRKKRHRSGNI